jgi:hypothetical protein
MQSLRRLLAILLCSAMVTWAQGNSFDKVRYNGGSVDSKVDPKDWNNRLTITSDMISCKSCLYLPQPKAGGSGLMKQQSGSG